MIGFIKGVLRHAKIIIVLTLALTVVMAFQAVRVNVDTNVNNLMPQSNTRIREIREEIGVESEQSNYLILSISGDDLFDLDILGTYQDTIDAVMAIPGFEGSLTPFDFIHFEAEGRRIIPGTMSSTGRAPETPEELELFEQRVKGRSLSENFVVADEGRILTTMFLTSLETAGDDLVSVFKETIKPLEEVATVHYTGELPFRERVAQLLGKDFSTLLGLALVTMLVIFWLSFRTARAVILPVIVMIIGATWTVGFMSLAGFPITVVSVVIPSLILTIGSSYTIHVLSEYYRNTRAEGAEKNQWLAEAVQHVVRTVVVAALTTMICFLSLLVTTLQPLREFGLSISLGIFFCAVLALFFLPSVFSVLPPPRQKHSDRIHRGWLTRIVETVGGYAARHRFLALGIFMALFAGFLTVYPHIRHQSDYFSYFPASDRIIQDTRFINENSGGSQTFNITLTAPGGEESFFLDPEVLQKVDAFETALHEHPCVTNKLSFLGILKSMNAAVEKKEAVPESRGLILLLNRFFRMIPTDKFALGQDSAIISDDGSSLTIYLKMAEAGTYRMMNEDDVRDFIGFVESSLETHIGDSMHSYLWGNTILLLDSSWVIKRDQMISTFISMALGVLVTWFVFRSFAFSLFALIPLLSGIFCYYITLFVLNIPLDMTTILVTNVTVGVGLDDAVHFILQYRHQRERYTWPKALANALRITGRAIVLTTVSLVAGLLILCFASFTPVVYFGLLVAGTLLSTMIGTVVFIPVAIVFFERMRMRREKRLRIKAAS